MTTETPFKQINIKGRRITVCITANFAEGPYTAVMFMNGESMEVTNKRGKFKTLQGAKQAASQWIEKHGYLS